MKRQQIDYRGFVRRRKKIILLTFVCSLVLSVTVTFLLPATFRSTATILIEGQESPADLVHSALGTMVNQRIKTLKQIILSRDNMINLIRTLDLFPKAESSSIEDLVDRMRHDIHVEPIEAGSGGMSMGRAMDSTIAFTLSFEGHDAEKTHGVVQHLVTQFLAENLQTRESKAWVTYNFLKEQLSALKGEILLAEEQIAVFKDKNLHALPEFMSVNIQTADNLQKEIEVKQIQLTAARDRKLYLEGLLTTLDPSKQLFSSDGRAVLTVDEKLASLRNQYVTMKSMKSEKHPDVVDLRSQIAALEKVADASQRLDDLQEKLKTKRNQREIALKRYSKAHPDVVSLNREIAQLEKDVVGAVELSMNMDVGEPVPDNPAYVNTQTQIEGVKLEVDAIQEELVRLSNKLMEYRSRLEIMPKVEQDYIALKRHYNSLKEKYDEIFTRIQAARETLDLEQKQIREKFTVIEKASYPYKPFKPKRGVLLVLGTLFSVALAGGVGVAAENLDHTVHTAGGLQQLSGHRLLGVVPYMMNGEEVESSNRRKKLTTNVIAALAAVILVALLAVGLMESPQQGPEDQESQGKEQVEFESTK